MVKIEANEQSTIFCEAKPWIRLIIVTLDQNSLIQFLIDLESHPVHIGENEGDSLIIEVHDPLDLNAKILLA